MEDFLADFRVGEDFRAAEVFRAAEDFLVPGGGFPGAPLGCLVQVLVEMFLHGLVVWWRNKNLFVPWSCRRCQSCQSPKWDRFWQEIG